MAYAHSSGAMTRTWQDLAPFDIAFGAAGPMASTITHDSGAAAVTLSALIPDGNPILLEVDARQLGVPDVWLGRATQWSEDVTAGTFTVSLAGPESWLSQLGIQSMSLRRDAAGSLVREIVAQHPGPHRLEIGTINRGAIVETQLSGSSLWSMMQDLASRTGEEPVLTALPGEARLRLDWRDPFDVPDARRAVTLIEGRTVGQVQLGGNLAASPAELVGVAQSTLQTNRGRSAAVAWPGRPALGKRAALATAMRTRTAQQLAGGPVTLAVDSPGYDQLVRQLTSELRRRRPTGGGTAVVLDTALYPYMRPRTLVSASLSDSLGIYRRAVAQIRTVTWSLSASVVDRCTISFELWSTAEEED